MEMDRVLNILLVDDDADDHLFFKEAIRDIEVAKCDVASVYNGSQALNFLLKEGAYSNCKEPAPDLIIVDLNMPVMNGISLLNIVKNNNQLKNIPVYILTTSNTLAEREKCERLGCNGFYTKPITIPKLHNLVEEILYQIK
jgi:chemotaxis family two-component system response regulator Rcp1